MVNCKRIFEILNKDYDHEMPEIPRTKEFGRAYKAILRKLVAAEGYDIVNHDAYSCCVSGFVTDGKGHYVYYSTDDYRFNPNEWRDRILIRKAENASDYKGGANHFTSLDHFAEEVKHLMR